MTTAKRTPHKTKQNPKSESWGTNTWSTFTTPVNVRVCEDGRHFSRANTVCGSLQSIQEPWIPGQFVWAYPGLLSPPSWWGGAMWKTLESWSYRAWFVRRSQVGLRNACWGLLSLGLSRKAGWIPGVTQRELCAYSSAFCPLERACKLLTHSPPPCSVELLLFLSGAFVDSTVNREICVLKERVAS